MSIILDIIKFIIGALTGEVFDQLRMEDTVEDAEPELESLDPDLDIGIDLDRFDRLLDSDEGPLRPSDEAA